MKKECDVKRCDKKVVIVYLTICAEGHIEEFYLCNEHAVTIWLHGKSCAYVHPIVDHMAATVDGGEPQDYRFYLGEWVAVQDNKVIGHGPNPEDLVEFAMDHNYAGTNIWQVREEHLGRLNGCAGDRG